MEPCRRWEPRQGPACSLRGCCSGGAAGCFPKLFQRRMGRSPGRRRQIFYLQRCQQRLLRRARPAPCRAASRESSKKREQTFEISTNPDTLYEQGKLHCTLTMSLTALTAAFRAAPTISQSRPSNDNKKVPRASFANSWGSAGALVSAQSLSAMVDQ
jgi:hypothetical protein